MTRTFEYLAVTAMVAALAIFAANFVTAQIGASLQSSAAMIANANS